MRTNRFTLFIALLAICTFTSAGSAQINKVVALLKGNVMSASGGAASDVSVSVFKGSEVINKTKATADGKFQVILQPGTQYRVAFSGGKYYYHEEMLSVPQSDVYQTVPMSVTLNELELGRPYHFSSLIFEPKSSDISSAVMADMENIASALKHNSKLTVSATVYPDETPSGKKAAAQNTLAQSRKSALMSFFMAKNIPSSSVVIDVASSVQSGGSFERTITEDAPAAKGKKTKKKAAAATASGKKVMVPQNAQITMQMAS